MQEVQKKVFSLLRIFRNISEYYFQTKKKIYSEPVINPSTYRIELHWPMSPGQFICPGAILCTSVMAAMVMVAV